MGGGPCCVFLEGGRWAVFLLLFFFTFFSVMALKSSTGRRLQFSVCDWPGTIRTAGGAGGCEGPRGRIEGEVGVGQVVEEGGSGLYSMSSWTWSSS